MDLEKFLMFEQCVMLDEVSRLANFYSIILPVEYGDGTLANEKFISLDELEKKLQRY